MSLREGNVLFPEETRLGTQNRPRLVVLNVIDGEPVCAGLDRAGLLCVPADLSDGVALASRHSGLARRHGEERLDCKDWQGFRVRTSDLLRERVRNFKLCVRLDLDVEDGLRDRGAV